MRANRKVIILSAITALILVVGIFVYVQRKSDNQPKEIDQTQQEAELNAKAKQQVIEGNDNSLKNTPSQSSTSPSPSPTPSPQSTIELSARQETNNTVTVFTKLPGYSDGTCELTVTNGTKTHLQTARIIYQPEYSSCAGFSVPISELGKGTWSIKLSTTSNGPSESKSISLEVK